MQKIEGFDNLLLMVGEMNGTIKGIDKKLNGVVASHDNHESRIGDLEKGNSFEAGSNKSYGLVASGFISIAALVAAVVALFK